MKIEKVIHASNDEPFYLDFWPLVSKIWKQKFNIEPILLYFGNQKIDETYGKVIKMEQIDGVPLNTQCQISRYWIPITEPNTTWMTSDIDMFPISKQYFVNQLIDIPDDKFVNINPKRGETHPHIHYSCCYNIAKGKTFSEILNLSSSWKEFVSSGFWKNNTHDHKPDGLGKVCNHWGADEMWSSSLINSFPNQDRIIRRYRDGSQSSHRIDRLSWRWSDDKVKTEDYYDCHSIRPYKVYKESIDRLINLILNK
jgi:hypothetical protein